MGEEVQQAIPESSEVPKEEVETKVTEEPTSDEPVVTAEEQKEAVSAEAPEAKEKTVETVEESNGEEAAADRELNPPPAEEPAVPFKEESYYVKDLKESEKKALQELKAKISEAIKANSFLAPPKPEATREVEIEKKEVAEETGEVVKAEEEAAAAEGRAPAGEEEAPAAPSEEATAAEEVAPSTEEAATEEPPAAEETLAAATEAEPAAAAEVEVEKTDREVVMEEVDDSPSLEDLALWGVPLLPTKGDDRTDVILLKFLRARDFKVNDAFGMLQETLVWRKDFNADGLVEEETAAPSEYESVAYMHGCDKEGHPVCYNHYGAFQDKELYHKTFEDDAQFRSFLRWRIQLLEKSIVQKLDFSASGVHSMVQITDLKDSPGFLKLRNITKKALTLLQDNYPELVAKQIFINVPWYFGALYAVNSKIVTPRSRSKVVVARPGKVTETLFKYISPENVPLQYGGLSRPNDTEFEGVEAPVKDVTVKPGEKQTIELPVEEAGSTVLWDVAVVGWEVVYGEEFVPSAEGSYTVIIQKSKKVASSEEPLRNSFKATEPGKVLLTIDNTASRRKRLVVFRHTVKTS